MMTSQSDCYQQVDEYQRNISNQKLSVQFTVCTYNAIHNLNLHQQRFMKPAQPNITATIAFLLVL